ncbi:MAG: ATP-binding protein [Actinomycetota bacterium]|nr:ATP-binding protein [Actinomycetota bacterium]
MTVVCTTWLASDPLSARKARQFVVATLLGWDVEHLIDTASLLTSELVTNAVLHANSEIELRLAKEADLIRFEVEDHGRGRPKARHPAPEETSGRGLALVDTLSSAWGVTPIKSGKSVWFELTT